VLGSSKYFKTQLWQSQLVDAHSLRVRTRNFHHLGEPILSATLLRCLFRILPLLLIVLSGFRSQAQDLKIVITIPSEAGAEALIDGQYSPGATNFSFRNSYGSVLGLAERIEGFDVVANNGGATTAQKVGPGEYRSTTRATNFRYRVKLGLPENQSDMAHTSWLEGGSGLLMLADLVPKLDGLEFKPLIVDFLLPSAWRVASAIKPTANHFLVQKSETAIFFVGRSLRETTAQVGSIQFAFITSSKWSFSDGQVLKIAEEVLNDYSKRIVPDPTSSAVLMLVPFPRSRPEVQWSAETRGSTTAIVFNEGGKQKYALAQLAIALTHEFFHFWVPNGLALTGDYDWFFEGFTIYQASQTAVRLGYIDFNEYLNTIARVYHSYLSVQDRDRFSLIEASQRRFTGESSVVYDKGMLVGFLCDLILRYESDGRSSLDDVYRSLFRIRGESQDANKAIIKALSLYAALKQFADAYIVQNGSLELEGLIGRYGLEIQSNGQEKRLVTNSRLDPRQLRVLRSLGLRH